MEGESTTSDHVTPAPEKRPLVTPSGQHLCGDHMVPPVLPAKVSNEMKNVSHTTNQSSQSASAWTGNNPVLSKEREHQKPVLQTETNNDKSAETVCDNGAPGGRKPNENMTTKDGDLMQSECESEMKTPPVTEILQSRQTGSPIDRTDVAVIPSNINTAVSQENIQTHEHQSDQSHSAYDETGVETEIPGSSSTPAHSHSVQNESASGPKTPNMTVPEHPLDDSEGNSANSTEKSASHVLKPELKTPRTPCERLDAANLRSSDDRSLVGQTISEIDNSHDASMQTLEKNINFEADGKECSERSEAVIEEENGREKDVQTSTVQTQMDTSKYHTSVITKVSQDKTSGEAQENVTSSSMFETEHQMPHYETSLPQTRGAVCSFGTTVVQNFLGKQSSDFSFPPRKYMYREKKGSGYSSSQPDKENNETLDSIVKVTDSQESITSVSNTNKNAVEPEGDEDNITIETKDAKSTNEDVPNEDDLREEIQTEETPGVFMDVERAEDGTEDVPEQDLCVIKIAKVRKTNRKGRPRRKVQSGNKPGPLFTKIKVEVADGNNTPPGGDYVADEQTVLPNTLGGTAGAGDTFPESPESPLMRRVTRQAATQRRERKFQLHWVKQFPWLIYDSDKNLMFCQVCMKHRANSKATSFIKGNNSFKIVALRSHDESKEHQTAMNLHNTTRHCGCGENRCATMGKRQKFIVKKLLQFFSWLRYSNEGTTLSCKLCDQHLDAPPRIKLDASFHHDEVLGHRDSKQHRDAEDIEISSWGPSFDRGTVEFEDDMSAIPNVEASNRQPSPDTDSLIEDGEDNTEDNTETDADWVPSGRRKSNKPKKLRSVSTETSPVTRRASQRTTPSKSKVPANQNPNDLMSALCNIMQETYQKVQAKGHLHKYVVGAEDNGSTMKLTQKLTKVQTMRVHDINPWVVASELVCTENEDITDVDNEMETEESGSAVASGMKLSKLDIPKEKRDIPKFKYRLLPTMGKFKFSWLEEFPWLDYNENTNVMVCKLCVKHQKKNSFYKGCRLFQRPALLAHAKLKMHLVAEKNEKLSQEYHKPSETWTRSAQSAIEDISPPQSPTTDRQNTGETTEVQVEPKSPVTAAIPKPASQFPSACESSTERPVKQSQHSPQASVQVSQETPSMSQLLASTGLLTTTPTTAAMPRPAVYPASTKAYSPPVQGHSMVSTSGSLNIPTHTLPMPTSFMSQSTTGPVHPVHQQGSGSPVLKIPYQVPLDVPRMPHPSTVESSGKHVTQSLPGPRAYDGKPRDEDLTRQVALSSEPQNLTPENGNYYVRPGRLPSIASTFGRDSPHGLNRNSPVPHSTPTNTTLMVSPLANRLYGQYTASSNVSCKAETAVHDTLLDTGRGPTHIISSSSLVDVAAASILSSMSAQPVSSLATMLPVMPQMFPPGVPPMNYPASRQIPQQGPQMLMGAQPLHGQRDVGDGQTETAPPVSLHQPGMTDPTIVCVPAGTSVPVTVGYAPPGPAAVPVPVTNSDLSQGLAKPSPSTPAVRPVTQQATKTSALSGDGSKNLSADNRDVPKVVMTAHSHLDAPTTHAPKNTFSAEAISVEPKSDPGEPTYVISPQLASPSAISGSIGGPSQAIGKDSNMLKEYDKLKRSRSFQSHWCKSHPWLIYDDDKNAMYCKVCIRYKLESTFTTGNRSFRLGTIKAHEGSILHQKAVQIEFMQGMDAF